MGCEGGCGGGAYRGAEGLQRGAEGAEGCRGGRACQGVQTECQGAPRGRVQRVWRCRWTFLSCWNFSVVAQMPCITSYRRCGAQSGRGVVQHIAARSRGTWECTEGRRRVERHAAGSNGDGEAREQKKESCPAAIRLWRACDA